MLRTKLVAKLKLQPGAQSQGAPDFLLGKLQSDQQLRVPGLLLSRQLPTKVSLRSSSDLLHPRRQTVQHAGHLPQD